MARTEIGKLATRVKNIDKNLLRTGSVTNQLRQDLLSELDAQLSTLPDTGNMEMGGANDRGVASSVSTNKTVNLRWVGEAVYYLEFGTGAPAVGAYPDASRMAEAVTEYGPYAPRPDNHWNGWRRGAEWKLPEEYGHADGSPVYSSGWVPYAPFYKTIHAYESGKFKDNLEREVQTRTKTLITG